MVWFEINGNGLPSIKDSTWPLPPISERVIVVYTLSRLSVYCTTIMEMEGAQVELANNTLILLGSVIGLSGCCEI